MQFRLAQKDLFDTLDVWDNNLKQRVFVAEREYYSRVVKPRVKALKNADLQLVASTLLS